MQTENSTENTTTTTYNGWTNYATWRVNLELVDEYMNEINTYRSQCIRNDWNDFQTFESVSALADHLAEYCEQIIDEQCSPETLANGYATAFLHQVNWYEIAKTYTDDDPELISVSIGTLSL